MSSWEVIAINDNSADDSSTKLHNYSSKDPRIRCIALKENGLVAALNLAISYSKSDLVARMDADDVMHPERLKKQYQFLSENQNYGLVSSCVHYRNDSRKSSGLGYKKYVEWTNQILSHDQISISRFEESPIAHPSVAFRKNLISKYGGYKQGPFPEDYELWLRWLASGIRMHKLKRILLDWHDCGNRLSRRDPRYSKKSFQYIKSLYLPRWLSENDLSSKKISAWGAGRVARNQARLLVQNGLSINKFYEVDPKKIGKICMSAPILDFKQLTPSSNEFLLILAGARRAKFKIDHFLQKRNFIKGIHYLSLV